MSLYSIIYKLTWIIKEGILEVVAVRQERLEVVELRSTSILLRLVLTCECLIKNN